MSPTVPPTSTDHHICAAGVRQCHDAVLDLVGDMRDHLDRPAEVLAAALLADHRRVDLPRCHAARLCRRLVREALVVAEVQIGLRAVVRHVDLAVLIRRHRTRIDVDVGVELHDGDGEPTRLEQPPHRGNRDALANRRRDAARDKQKFSHLRSPVAHRLRTPHRLRSTTPARLARSVSDTRHSRGNPQKRRGPGSRVYRS